jgi:hypothetical protein
MSCLTRKRQIVKSLLKDAAAQVASKALTTMSPLQSLPDSRLQQQLEALDIDFGARFGVSPPSSKRRKMASQPTSLSQMHDLICETLGSQPPNNTDNLDQLITCVTLGSPTSTD